MQMLLLLLIRVSTPAAAAAAAIVVAASSVVVILAIVEPATAASAPIIVVISTIPTTVRVASSAAASAGMSTRVIAATMLVVLGTTTTAATATSQLGRNVTATGRILQVGRILRAQLLMLLLLLQVQTSKLRKGTQRGTKLEKSSHEYDLNILQSKTRRSTYSATGEGTPPREKKRGFIRGCCLTKRAIQFKLCFKLVQIEGRSSVHSTQRNHQYANKLCVELS